MKEKPIKKAWACLLPEISWHDFQHSPEIVYAETRSKARYLVMLRWDWIDQGWIYIKVRRSPKDDLYAPKPADILSELTDELKKIIAHANGNDSREPGYRGYYNCSTKDPNLLRLVDLGLMIGPQHVKSNMVYPENGYFYLTDVGKNAAFSMLPRKEATA